MQVSRDGGPSDARRRSDFGARSPEPLSRVALPICVFALLLSGCGESKSKAKPSELLPTWDWNGIVGTGQSLAVGGLPVSSRTQPYNNLKLDLGDAEVVPSWDPELEGLSMVPLVEPIRQPGSGFPRPYPRNIWGETPHSAMGNQITALIMESHDRDLISVHTVVGESGEGIASLAKQEDGETTGGTGRAYAATLFEAQAISRLAAEADMTYGIGAIVMTHGETDSGNSNYDEALIQLLEDYNADLAEITGQDARIPMLMSQQFAYPDTAGMRPVSTQIQWQLGVDHPHDFVCTGPKYQYPGHEDSEGRDGVHLAAEGYQMLGEKTGQVYYERLILGNEWMPLHPTAAERDGNAIIVTFHVPVPPLTWDESFPEPSTAWSSGRGFEVRQGSTEIGITDVEISGDTVRIRCDGDLPESELTVGYAMTAGTEQMDVASYAYRFGHLRDSDPFVGSTTSKSQPNYCVAFELKVP